MTTAPLRLTSSVALCTYNGATFLREQMDSILAQSRLPDEIVVRDDRSTDDTARIVAEVAARAPIPIRMFGNEERLGSTRNFLAAIADTHGEIVFLSDQDDVWLPRKVEKMMAVFEERAEVGLVISDAVAVDRDLTPLGYTVLDSLPLSASARKCINGGQGTHLALKQPFGTGSSMAMRATLKAPLLQLARPEFLIHDSWLLMVADAYSAMRIIDDPLNLYRQHAGQQVGAPPKWRASAADAEVRGGDDSHRRQLQTYRQLQASLVRNGRFAARPPFAAAVDAAVTHASRRLSLPSSRPARVPVILDEWISGRYRRFSTGWKSAAKDLLR